MGLSKYLDSLSPDQYKALSKELWELQKKHYFIMTKSDCSDLLSLRQTDTVIMKSDKWNCKIQFFF